MGFQVSPGVVVTEKDLTTIVPAVSTTDGAFAGVFTWGPLNQIVLVGDENQLVQKFGKPTDDNFTSFFTAANFLAYGNKLRLVRVADTISVQEFSNLTALASAGATTITIDGTALVSGTYRVRFGDTLKVAGLERNIISATTSNGDVVLTVDVAFPDDVNSTTATVLVSKGPLNATSEEYTGSGTSGIGILIQNDEHYQNDFANGMANVGPFVARHPGDLGNSLKVSICASGDAFKQTLAGTFSNAQNSVILTSSDGVFLNKCSVGTIVKDLYSGAERTITKITNASTAEISAPFKNGLTGATLQARWEYADVFGIAPETSSYVARKNGKNDELHVVVVDADGKFTGVKGTILERHGFLSKASDAKTEDGSSLYYVDVLNNKSEYIRWTDHLQEGLNWGSEASSQSNGVIFEPLATTAKQHPSTYLLRGGRDANTTDAIDAAREKGYDLFVNAELVDVSLVLLGETKETALPLHVINNICETRKDCIAFVSPPRDAVVNNKGDEVTDIITFRNTLGSTSYAVMDSGWKYQYDKYNDKYRWVPLNADIAGLCVRTDTNNDPWWSPAGYNRGGIKSVIKLAFNPFKAERDDLYLNGINPVITQPGQGTVLFGDKTLLAKPSAFDRINVRRLFIVLEKAISTASKFMLFEFNDEFTRQQFRSLVEPYLRDVQSRRGIYDFKVVCDRTNNTSEVVDRNEFVGDIYIKPARSINFIQLNFIAVRTGVDFSEIIGRA